jgi:Tfp pilus assembly protein PilW
MHRRKNTSGIMLIELVTAITVSMLILGSLFIIGFSVQKNYSDQEAWHVMEENAQIALHILRMDVGASGYMGCGQSAEIKITGSKSQADEVAVRHASTIHFPLIESMKSSNIIAVNTSKIKIGDMLLISDCHSVETFQVKAVGENKITTVKNLSKMYDKYAEISHLEFNTYFIKKTTRYDANHYLISALYSKDIYQHQAELVERVDDMQINYDIEEAGKLVTVKYNQIKDSAAIRGVSIQLVLSADNTILKRKFYAYITPH